jgi:hypothetical protein
MSRIVQVIDVEDFLFTLVKVGVFVLFFSIIMLLQLIGGAH